MIRISVYGLDSYTVGHYSRDHTKNLASLFETKEEDIVFVSTDEFVFFKGVEQTSWQTIVQIDAPEKYEPLEDKVAQYLLKTFVDFSIHVNVLFEYHHGHHEHSFVNKEYPRYIEDKNLVNVEESEEDELYEGNVFEGMEKQLEEAYKEGCSCGCDDECDCDCEEGECECDGEHECHCGHHH